MHVLYTVVRFFNQSELGEIMKKIMKTNDKHGFSRYLKANMDSKNIKVKEDFISAQEQFHIH